MLYGTVTRVVPEHGFGFIVDDAGMDWFFIERGIRGASFSELWLNERVGFAPEWTPSGPRAVDIHHEQGD
jgi:cold shock CspA family protein